MMGTPLWHDVTGNCHELYRMQEVALNHFRFFCCIEALFSALTSVIDQQETTSIYNCLQAAGCTGMFRQSGGTEKR